MASGDDVILLMLSFLTIEDHAVMLVGENEQDILVHVLSNGRMRSEVRVRMCALQVVESI